MKGNKILFWVLFVSIAGVLTNVLAKHIQVGSAHRFNRIASPEKRWSYGIRYPKHSLAVVLFFHLDRRLRRDDREAYKKMQTLLSDFGAARTHFPKSDRGSGLVYASVNLTKTKNHSLGTRFNITKTPVCLLFKDGVLQRDASGEPAVLTGFFSTSELVSWIGKHFGKDIKENLENWSKVMSKRSLYRDSFWPYNGYGYYGWGWPYGRSYWGGWGWPYGGWGWGSRGCW